MKSLTLFSALLSTVLAGIFTTAVLTAQPKGERVTVTGTLVKNPNAQMIYIDTVR